jgi:hypothetical protein
VSAPALRACVLAACALASQARAQPTPTPIVRDHRVTTVAPTATPKAAGLAKYTVEGVITVPLAPRTSIPDLLVAFRCPTCSSSESLKGVTAEIWYTPGAGAPRLIGSRFNVELQGQGDGCGFPHSTCFSVPTGGFPAAEGAFIVKLIKDNSLSTSTFEIVPSALKISGPTLRDHR